MVLVLSAAAFWLSKRSKKQQLEKEQGGKSRSSEEEIAEGDESTHSLLRQNRYANDHQHAEDIIEENVAMSVLSPSRGQAPSRNSKRDSANILAGALYGPWFGTFITSLLTTLGSVLAYFMSFFLMGPIMDRYASTRLDQMRTQIEKKTSRSKSSKKASPISTATSTSSSLSSPAGTLSAGPTATTRGNLRTRSASFTVRKNDSTDQGVSPVFSYPHQSGSANVLSSSNVVTPSHRDDIEIQESEGLLSEEYSTEKVSFNNNNDRSLDINESSETDSTEDEEDEDEGTSLFMQLLLIRLFPLTPYWFINLASPLVGVPVIPFMTSMFLG
ncbi:hypothetical protein FBU30_002588, partial [Linnemannia zychae]